jgi:predicted deacylase
MIAYGNAHNLESIPRVDQLEIGSLPTGRTTRLRVALAHDGLGRASWIPVIVVRGQRDGPTFGITAAIHGNELNGIPVIHRLVERLDPSKLRGNLVCIPVVNIPGYLLKQRTFGEGMDLNQNMPGVVDGNACQVYAHRFVERVVRHFDYLADLHTASFGRVNSLYVRANMNNERTRAMAYLQRPEIILNDPPNDRTLRGAAEDMGIPAITVEIRDPHRLQRETARRALSGLRAVFAHVGMLPKRKRGASPAPVICASSRWLYTDRGGLLEVIPDLTARVSRGDVIARLTSVFGDLVCEYRAPDDGIVIGKAVEPVAQTGARILHLGRLAESQEMPMASQPAEASGVLGI